jgi:hypothetical protein
LLSPPRGSPFARSRDTAQPPDDRVQALQYAD